MITQEQRIHTYDGMNMYEAFVVESFFLYLECNNGQKKFREWFRDNKEYVEKNFTALLKRTLKDAH